MNLTSADETTAQLAAALGLGVEVIEGRRRLLGFDEAAAARLRAMAPAAIAAGPGFIDLLYRRLLACTATATWLRSDDQIARLKRAQLAHHERLFAGDVDWATVLDCLRIGSVHHRVRLSPQWYVATFAHWVADHVELAFATATSTADGVDHVAALLGRVLLEVSLALDAYGVCQARVVDQRVERARGADPADGRRVSADPATSRGPGAVSRLRLPSDTVAQRASFVELDDGVRATLRAAAPAIEAALPAILDDFYRFFTSYPPTAALVPAHQVDHLKQQVASYWRELARADFDRPYAASRARIGMVHERIGLSVELYLFGLARQTVGLLRHLVATTTAPVALVQALVRALFFDLSLVLDAYMEARAEALLRSEGYAAELVAGITAGVAVVDGPGRWVESANPALLTMFGLDAQLVRHLPVEAIVPVPGVRELLERVVIHGEARAMAVRRSGSRTFRATALRLTAASGPDGRRRAALVLDELTDVNRVGDDAIALEQGLAQLTGSIRAVLWEADVATATVHLISPPVLELTGFRDVYFLGRARAWLELVPEPERGQLAARGAALGVGDRCEIVHRLRRADGVVRWVRTELVGVRVDDQAVVRGVSVDVTAELHEQRNRLAAIGRLAGGVAHEFNNILMVVDSSLTLLGETANLGPDAADLVATTLDATRRAAELTRNLLAFAERQPLRNERLVVNDVVQEVARSLGARLGSSVRLVLELEQGLGACDVDRGALAAALVSLIDNALIAMPGGGRVVVSTRTVAAAAVATTAPGAGVDHVEVAVRDTGAGMAPETLARAFEPFFSTRPAASGLGLASVHGFVQQSGGHVVLDSVPGVGTEVRLRLPTVAAALPRVRPLDSDRPRVLVVDDEPALRQVIVRLLERDGIATLSASDAREALDLLAAAPVAVLVTDVVLGGGMSGGELGREARRRRPGLPVIYISGYTRSDLHLAELAADEWFLSKPIAVGRLREVVRLALAAHLAASAAG